MIAADEIVLIGRLLEHDPVDNPDGLDQVLASCTDINMMRVYTRQSGLLRKSEMTPVRLQASK